VRKFGVVFDSDLSLTARVSQQTARCYSCLRRIKSCRRALTRITAATVVNSLIVTKLQNMKNAGKIPEFPEKRKTKFRNWKIGSELQSLDDE